ncbi:MAG: GntR family transcriptional regulator [Chloroflexota bacterium]
MVDAGTGRQYSTLREWAFLRLRDMIVSGELAPGADLNERELCDQLHISKSPLREALRQLAQEGLVVAAANKGSYVAELTVEDIDEIHTLRYYLEVLEVRLAATRVTPEQIAELRQNIAAMEACSDAGDDKGSAGRDTEFHLMLARIAGHRRLLRVQEGLQADLRRAMAQQRSWRGQQGGAAATARHRSIVEALEAHDPDRAADLMRAHIRHAEEILQESSGRTLPADPVF